MITYPHAKINIGLYITRLREDGYHDLETIFYPVCNEKDKLEIDILKQGDTRIEINGIAVPSGSLNLCLKAYNLLRADYKLSPVRIKLHKNIPVGAGLGGGSADAAFTLKMLNHLFQLNLSILVLEQYALKIGSDVPFFIRDVPAFATSRGECLLPISLDLSSWKISLVHPPLSISTQNAFAEIKPRPATFDLKQITRYPVEDWKNFVHNDFEKTVFARYPLLQQIKEQLYAKGAVYASLSGSGSSLFAIAHEKIELDN
ncbi:MAG: 4-(cytidine 5'-diphospho)-2-C-methyl-D-erythritol kinase [Bacteroidales bacterium]|jgi:4-diphosphocytidyl-2-C-methyl-D-erythritol kinase|nr:4-(cytidine 5'-diphospho)-2-C-methyl-D-erythritol kinase [Bacteroidales bacterium]